MSKVIKDFLKESSEASFVPFGWALNKDLLIVGAAAIISFYWVSKANRIV